MQCSKQKIVYRTRLEAESAQADILKNGRGETRIYACITCEGFHLTSKPANVKTQLRKAQRMRKKQREGLTRSQVGL
jgi:hypothetical protein